LASDRRVHYIMVFRSIDGREGGVTTNQFDDESLEAAVRTAERMSGLFVPRDKGDFKTPRPGFEYPKTAAWNDTTYGLSTETRALVAREVIEPAEAKEMLSAGYLEVRGEQYGEYWPDGRVVFGTCTQAQCSTTVRDATGTGSGWAGLSGTDWSAIDTKALAARALQKAIASRNPVSLEPGRYTVILEPQAVHDLISILIASLQRRSPDLGFGPYTLGYDAALGLFRTKLGLKVVDERITIEHDPSDPLLGVLPFDEQNYAVPYRPVKWIDHGILTALADNRAYSLETRNDNLPSAQSSSFRMSGGDTTMEEMIKGTKRGLLVTRFSNMRLLDLNSLLSTGLTRDGLWLIENGQISKAVKNFRFTESPLFVLNSLDQLGVPVPVYRPHEEIGVTPAIVPPIKARDFSFTSTIDAI